MFTFLLFSNCIIWNISFIYITPHSGQYFGWDYLKYTMGQQYTRHDSNRNTKLYDFQQFYSKHFKSLPVKITRMVLTCTRVIKWWGRMQHNKEGPPSFISITDSAYTLCYLWAVSLEPHRLVWPAFSASTPVTFSPTLSSGQTEFYSISLQTLLPPLADCLTFISYALKRIPSPLKIV